MPKINKVNSQGCKHPNSQIVPTARSSRQQPSLLKNSQGARQISRQISQKTNHVLEWSSRSQTNIKDNGHVREQSSNIRPLYCWNGDVMILYWNGTVLEYLASSLEWRQRWLAGMGEKTALPEWPNATVERNAVWKRIMSRNNYRMLDCWLPTGNESCSLTLGKYKDPYFKIIF